MPLTHNRLVHAAAAAAIVVVAGTIATAYVSFGKWSSKSVTYYINPTNLDVTADAAEAATQGAASAWTTQTNANFQFVYGGRVNDTTTGYDQRNVVIYRNASNGGALATTYYWYSSNTISDADIVVWDGAYQFYTGSGSCSGGAYIEDVLTHEFGHALGLSHSDVADATMYPYYSYCSEDMRSLSSDDIAGVQSLYPPTGQQTNTAPSTTISGPANGASVSDTTVVAFSGSANDTQDGNLSANLVWTSSADGPLGTGANVSHTLTVGTHLITASVTDSGNMSGSSTVTVYVTSSEPAAAPAPPPPATPTLAARGYKVKGQQKADLTWSGFSSNVDIYRNGSLIKTTANDGAETDAINKKGGGSYTYRACAAGTTTCSNDARVVF